MQKYEILLNLRKTNKKNLIDYHIHKIYYTIGKDKNIQSLKFEYMDRNTGEVKVLLDTVNSHIENENPIEITFTSLEEIKLMQVMKII